MYRYTGYKSQRLFQGGQGAPLENWLAPCNIHAPPIILALGFASPSSKILPKCVCYSSMLPPGPAPFVQVSLYDAV